MLLMLSRGCCGFVVLFVVDVVVVVVVVVADVVSCWSDSELKEPRAKTWRQRER